MATVITPRFLIQLILFSIIPSYLSASFIDYPSANTPSSWLNSPSTDRGSWQFSDGTHFRPILAVGKDGYPDFSFGFFNNGTANTFSLVILKLPNSTSVTYYTSPPVFIWYVNGSKPVREKATLRLFDKGLSLKDGNRTIRPVQLGSLITRMVLDSRGNLKLVNASNSVLWQSFRNPTNTLIGGQSYRVGQKIYSTVSTYNLARGSFFLTLNEDSISAAVYVKPSQPYQLKKFITHGQNTSLYFEVGSLDRSGDQVTYQARGKDFQYMRLEPNGHLNVFTLVDGFNQKLHRDLLEDKLYGECAYPKSCGSYGVCSNRSKCTCPGELSLTAKFFKPLDTTQINGCAEITPLSCQDTHLHTFLELKNVTYLRFRPMLSNIDAEKCKRECLGNCSCKGVMFRYKDDISRGDCFFPEQIFSLKAYVKEGSGYNFITMIKVQIPRSSGKNNSSFIILLVSSLLASITFIVILTGAYYYYLVRGKRLSIKMENEGGGERSSIQVGSLIKKFKFEDLVCATHNFQLSLGKGGFGSVFEGAMGNGDGQKIAVKRLNNQGKKDFLAEVKTIGSVHHFNLVRLIGYCTENSHRILVYEYMCNGSLDKWIFHQDQSHTLNWDTRQQIIVGIAKGLEYLHVHCNPNIIHFDIKPQNILLDGEFNVKICDFGLAKWIERGQSHVSTLAKGTPGYMAPELLQGRNISVKVDVYSFGIVILELVCGRKNLNFSQDEYLIDTVKSKLEGGRLSDLVDRTEDMQLHKEEAVSAMEIAIWCLQPYSRRPSIPKVVKVLEGSMSIEPITDYSFLTMFYVDSPPKVRHGDSAPLMDSILSGPR